MHWKQGSDIESKRDKLPSSAECRILATNHQQTEYSDKPIELSRVKLKKKSVAHPYEQRVLSPLDSNPTADMVSPLALATYMFVGAKLDALTTGKGYLIVCV